MDMIAHIGRSTTRSVGRGEDGAGAVGKSGGPFPFGSPSGSITQRLIARV